MTKDRGLNTNTQSVLHDSTLCVGMVLDQQLKKPFAGLNDTIADYGYSCDSLITEYARERSLADVPSFCIIRLALSDL